MGPTALRVKKTIHRQTKLNPAACDDTLRSKDTKRSVCARTEQYLYRFFTSDPPHCPTVLSVFTTAGAWRVIFFLLYGRSQTYKCVTATYLSNGPLTLYLQSQLGVSMVHLRDNALISLWSGVKQEEEDASCAGCCELSLNSQSEFILL